MKTRRARIYKRVSCAALSTFAFLGLSGCYLLPQEEQVLSAPELTVEAVTYDTQEIELSDIERWETGTGTFVSRYSESYSFEDDGVLKAVYVKSGQTVREGDLLAELDTQVIDERIAYQEYITEKARLNYLNISQNGWSYSSQIAKLDYDYQAGILEELYSQKTQSALYAGFDGIVTYAAGAAPGDSVAGGKVLVSVADQTALELQYEPKNLNDLYIGMEVTITLRNSKESFTGTISQTPAEIPEGVEDADRNCVYIRFEDAELDEMPAIGSSAYVEVLLERKEDVIVISAKNLYSTSNRYYVRVLVNEIPEERDVTVGISNGTEIEITGGLEVGEKLVV